MGFDVVINAFAARAGTTPAQVLEDLLGMDPVVARMMIRKLPSTVIQRTTRAHADSAAEQLREAGAEVEIVDRDPAQGLHAPATASAPGPEPATAPGPEPATAPPAQPETPGQRQLFNTVALRSLEDDLSRVDLETLPNKSEEVASQPAPPSWDAPLDEAPMLNKGPHRTSKQDLPNVDALFAAPKDRAAARASMVRADGLAAGGGLDDLFQAPGPAGVQNYFKRGAELLQNATQGARGGEAKHRVSMPQGASTHDGTDALSVEGESAAAKGKLKTLLSKAAAGIAALGLVAGTSVAVINAREGDVQGPSSKATSVESKEESLEWARDKERRRLHPAIRYAPTALAPAFGSILRKRVAQVFHVSVEWEDGPEDLDCMFVSAKDGKGDQRVAKLLRTGMQIAYPDDVKEQLKEHLESLRSARNDAHEEFRLLCLSVEAVEDLGKEPKKSGDDRMDDDL